MMFSGGSWSVEEVHQWLVWGRLDELLPEFLEVRRFSWPDSPEWLDFLYPAITGALPDDGRHLLAQALTAAALVQGTAVPDWAPAWLATHVNLGELGLPWNWDVTRKSQWQLVGVPMAAGGAGHLMWVLLGTCSDARAERWMPLWWEKVADREAAAAVDRALRLADPCTEGSFLFWPLLRSHGLRTVHGRSLALPLYLAAWGVRNGVTNNTLAATGDVDESGGLLPVEYLQEKRRAVRRAGFTGLIYPRPQLATIGGVDMVDSFAVEDLAQARFVWEHYRAGAPQSLLHDCQSLRDPCRLAANIQLLSPAVVSWTGFGEIYRQRLGEILANQAWTRSWLRNLEDLTAQPGYCLNTVTALLAPVSADCIERHGAEFPLEAFRIVQLQLRCANHQGDPAGVSTWGAVGKRLAKEVELFEEATSLTAKESNLRFIGERHVRYDFRPELDGGLSRLSSELLARLAARRATTPGAVCPSLGALYGTIAQNFGFCGPRYLEETLQYAALARDAFGGRHAKRYQSDWRRQYNYVTYALLDAGRVEEAREALCSNLERRIDDLNRERLAKMDPYQHALLARYLAQAEIRSPIYQEWAQARLADRPRRHPWQLWLYNVGFLFDTEQLRRSAWESALAACRSKDPAMRVMALLPLCALWEQDWVSSQTLQDTSEDLRTTIRASRLSQAHFAGVLACRSAVEMMGLVARERERLFPFSYR